MEFSHTNIESGRRGLALVFAIALLAIVSIGMAVGSRAGAAIANPYVISNSSGLGHIGGGAYLMNIAGGYYMGRTFDGEHLAGEQAYTSRSDTTPSYNQTYFWGRSAEHSNACFWVGPRKNGADTDVHPYISWQSGGTQGTGTCDQGQQESLRNANNIGNSFNCTPGTGAGGPQATRTTAWTSFYYNVNWSVSGSGTNRKYAATSAVSNPGGAITIPFNARVKYRYTSGNWAVVFVPQYGWGFVAKSTVQAVSGRYGYEDYSGKELACGTTGTPNLDPPALPGLSSTTLGPYAYDGRSSLLTGQSLLAGHYIMSEDVRTILMMQSDGNLVLYSTNYQPLWSSQTSDGRAVRASVTAGGDIALYDSAGVMTWNQGINAGSGTAALHIEDSGDLTFTVRGAASPAWRTGTVVPGGEAGNPTNTMVASGSLPSGGQLVRKQYVRSSDRRYSLVFQVDGNVVLYGPCFHPIWQLGTSGTRASLFAMQTDGNLVLYDPVTYIWNTVTQGNYGAHLDVQGDGNLVLYTSSGVPLWYTGTQGQA